MHGSLEAIDYADRANASTAPIWQKYRVQVPMILAFTAVIQYIASVQTTGSLALVQNVQATVLVSLLANFGGLVLYRRMRLFPGTRRLAFIIPSFAFAWGVALMTVTFLRIPYSVVQLAIGAISGVGLSMIVIACIRRPSLQEFLVLPGERVATALEQIPDLPHKVCKNASEIAAGDNPVIADLHADISDDWQAALAHATLHGRPVYHVKQISESLTGRVQVEHLSENSLGTLAPNESYAFLKAVAERVIAALLLVLLCPVLLTIAVLIALESPGAAIFRQTRVGHSGKHFTIFKFRTMREDTTKGTLESDKTQEKDPRITRLGHFLRQSRIDELPQIYNVLLGEMSFIGPRPETVQLSKWYADTIDFYPYRHVVLPGITGWAQVKQGHVTSNDDVMRKLQYDFYYIKNFSFWLDVVIALKTIEVTLLRLGAK